MARLTKKKTEAAQAAEVATENKETLAAEAAAEVAAEAVKATEEAAEPYLLTAAVGFCVGAYVTGKKEGQSAVYQ